MEFDNNIFYMQIFYEYSFHHALWRSIKLQRIESKKKKKNGNIDPKVEGLGIIPSLLRVDIRYSANGSKKITYYHGISIQSSLR